MFLIEAESEKEYIKLSITLVLKQIHNLITAKEEYGDEIQVLMKKLDSLYKKYQQFLISIERAKKDVLLEIDGTQISLLDILVILDVMEDKLQTFSSILKVSDERSKIDVVPLNMSVLFQEVEEVTLDIKTLKFKINKAMMETELG